MNPRAAKRRARYAVLAGALFFSWARPATGLAVSTWLTTTDADFKVAGSTLAGVQTRGTGVPAILELYRDWTSLSPPVPPSKRYTQGVWDTTKNRFFVFGGLVTSPGTYTNETWTFLPGTTAWTQISVSGPPSARDSVGLAYSTSTKLVYAFYGEDSVGNLRQLWTFDTNTGPDNVWTLQPGGGSSPTARGSAGAAYDEVGGRLIVFGGEIAGTPNAETWAWSGSAWTNLAPSTFPAARLGPAMTYAGNGKIVLFGGGSGAGNVLNNDTWIFISTSNTWWTSPKPAPAGLSARKRAHLAYDADLNRVVLFGGEGIDTGGVTFNDVWYYDVDQDSWVKVETPTPPDGRSRAAVAYSPSQKKLYVFGGSSNTASIPASYTKFYSLTPSPDGSATWTASLPFVSGAVKWGNLSWTPTVSSQPFQNPVPVKFQIVGQNTPTLSASLEGPVNASDFFQEVSTPNANAPVPARWDGLPYLFLRAYLTGSSTATPRLDSVTITYNRPPTVPALSGPADGSISASPTPTFTWSASTDADADTLRYRIYIATETGFTTLVGGSGDTPLTVTSFTPSTLNENRYYWRVEATDDPNGIFTSPPDPNASSGWSAVRTLNVLPGLTVDSQTSDTILVGTVTVNWTLSRAKPGATHTFVIRMDGGTGYGYTIVIATNLPNGTTSYAWDTRNVPNYNNPPGVYRIEVTAVGPYGDAAATSASVFRVVNTDPLSFTILKPVISTTSPNEAWTSTETLAGKYHLRWTNPYIPGGISWGWTLRVDISSDGGATWKAVYADGPNPGVPPLTDPVDPPWASTTIAHPFGIWQNTGQYADASPTANTNYLMRVFVADGGEESASTVRKGTVTALGSVLLANNNQVPNAFSLTAPAGGATVGSTQVEFSWQNTGNPGNEDKPAGYDYVNYTLYISTSATFAAKTLKSDIESFTPKTAVSVLNVDMAAFPKNGTAKVVVSLKDGTAYYWKVVGVDKLGAFRVSSETGFSFQVNTGGGVTTNIAPDTEITILSGPPIKPEFERRSATFTVESAGLPSALAARQPTVKKANEALRATPFAKMASAVAYEIGVFNADWTPDDGFKPGAFQARISVKYPSKDGKLVDNTQISVEKLRLVRLNESTGEWELATGTQSVNADFRVVVATVTRFSTFALLAYAAPSGTLDGLKSYPNPFAAGRDPAGKDCTIAYMLSKDSRIAVKIFSAVGDLVWQKTVEPPDPAATAQPVSPRKIIWDGRNEDGRLVANGGYILRLTASPTDGGAEETMTWKLAVLK